MAQSKLNDLAGKFGKGGPPGVGIGLKLLAGLGAIAYGATQSVYTGKINENQAKSKDKKPKWKYFVNITSTNVIIFRHNAELLH